MSDETVFEVVVFKARESVATDDLVEAAAAVNEFISGQAGFIDRRLLRPVGEDAWVDVLRWTDLAAAEAAAGAAMESPVCGRFFGLIDADADAMFHLRESFHHSA